MNFRRGSRVVMGYWHGTVDQADRGIVRVLWDERFGAAEDTEYLMEHRAEDLSPETALPVRADRSPAAHV